MPAVFTRIVDDQDNDCPAGVPGELLPAIDDVNRIEKLPITYKDLVPRRELAPYAQALALAAVLLLLAARLMEIRRWA